MELMKWIPPSKKYGIICAKLDFDKVLKELIQEQLAPARIIEVTSEEAEGHEGDPIVRIRVVFEAENDRLDPENMVGLARHLRPTLDKLNPDCFPVFSYATPEEIKLLTT